MGAIISNCGTYRYQLTRHCQIRYPDRGMALFVMLNPSTADADLDDPTIRRCMGFATSLFFSGIVVLNLYALRATNPQALKETADPIGPRNVGYLWAALKEYRDVVCAWGVNAPQDRVDEFLLLAAASDARMWCLGTTKGGAPRHPLYVKSSTKLIRWPPECPIGQESDL